MPLKTKVTNINNKTKKEFKDLQSLNKNYKYFKLSLLNSINSYETTFLEKIDSALETQYGKDFFNILKKDFGLSKFSKIRTNIFTDFKTSVDYYLNNKEYDVTQSTFGKKSKIRFEDCDVYDFANLVNEIQVILYKCVDFNLQSLKRRSVTTNSLPKEFSISELQKQIQNNLDSFNTFSETKRNVYSPDGTTVVFNDVTTVVKDTPVYTERGTLIKTMCKGYDQYGVYADGNGGSYEELIETNSLTCGYVPPSPPFDGGGGSGGGGGMGREIGGQFDTQSLQEYQK